MSRAQAWTLHLALLLVGGTGLVYAWMRYLCTPQDELALVNHPLQPIFQHAHLWSAPLLVFALGLVWSTHVWPRVRGAFPTRRRSGLVLFALALPLVFSGVWVQVAEVEVARRWSSLGHTALGLVFTGAYVLHLLTARPRS
jgi:hypothetical protein